MKTLKHIIKDQAAEEKNISEKDVEDILTFYWRDGIEKDMKSFKYESLYITNLGTFLIPLPLLRKEILTVIGRLRKYRGGDTDSHIRQEAYYTEYLKKLLSIRGPIAKRYTEYWQARKAKKLSETSIINN